MCSRCIHVVANNFAYLYDVTYNFLPFPLFVKLLNHKCAISIAFALTLTAPLQSACRARPIVESVPLTAARSI